MQASQRQKMRHVNERHKLFSAWAHRILFFAFVGILWVFSLPIAFYVSLMRTRKVIKLNC
jgi:hypothetical protein